VSRLKAVIAFVILGACHSLLGSAVAEVPVTNHLSSWPAQELVDVSELHVEVVPSNLKAIKHHTSVVIHLRGSLKPGPARERPMIEGIHVSERFEPDTRDPKRVAALVLTPVVALRKDRRYSGDPQTFAVDAHYRIYAWTSGTNTFVFRCGSLERVISLEQSF
jgi:hypothetical protein